MNIIHTEKCERCGTVFNRHDDGHWTWLLGKDSMGLLQECEFCSQKIETIISIDKQISMMSRMN